MKLQCPNCPEQISWFRGACPQCGFALTVPAVGRLLLTRIRGATAIQCPLCRRADLPFGTHVCPNCHQTPTFRDAVRAACEPVCLRVKHYFDHLPPQTKWWAQWLFLLFSAALLWWMLGEVDRRLEGHWFGAAAVSILHISALLFFAVWWMPRNFLFAISRYAPGKVKFALALNFFTGMLLLQLAIQVWWQRTTLLATLYVVLWLAAWLLNGWILPQAWLVRDAFFGSGNGYNPTSPQGRSARFD